MISPELMQYISLGPDITKVRGQLKENRDLIFTARLPEKFIQQQIKEVANQTIENNDQGINLEARKQRLMRVFMLKRVGLPILKEIINDTFEVLTQTPYEISYFNAYMIELMFSLKHTEHTPAKQYLITKGGRRATISNERILQALLNDRIREGKAEILKFYKSETPDSEDYPVLFTFTLRQTDLFLLDEFLHHHGKKFGEGFGEFLKMLLIDQEELLASKTIKATKTWIEEKWPCLQREILEAKETAVPKGKIKIQGRLKDHEIGEFFSFLHQVKDKGGRPALSKSDFDVIFENGLIIPNEVPKQQPYRLHLSADGVSMTALQYCIFKFYKLHEPESYFQDNDFKRNIARFFIYTFENFGELTAENIERRRRLIRDQKPAKMTFVIKDYFPESL